MKNKRLVLLLLLGIFIVHYLGPKSARSAEGNPWVLYMAAINAAVKKSQEPFPWILYNAAIQAAAHTHNTANKKTLVKEDGLWWGVFNGGRPTFYFEHFMGDYPKEFTVTLVGCETATVTNNGVRFETNKLILKQSDVGGRGMALTTQAGQCTTSKESYIKYYKEDMQDPNAPIIKY